MHNERHLFIIYDRKVAKYDFINQVKALNSIQKEYTFVFDEEIVESKFQSGDEIIREEIGFFKANIANEKTSIGFSVTYYSNESGYFGINLLKSEDFETLMRHMDRMLSLFLRELPGCILVGHDNSIPICASAVYEEYMNGTNLDDLYVYFLNSPRSLGMFGSKK